MKSFTETFLKIAAMLFSLLIGLRISSYLLLLADNRSDLDVLFSFFGMIALILAECFIFWVLFSKKSDTTTKEKE